jgi:hypothetical protein
VGAICIFSPFRTLARSTKWLSNMYCNYKIPLVVRALLSTRSQRSPFASPSIFGVACCVALSCRYLGLSAFSLRRLITYILCVIASLKMHRPSEAPHWMMNRHRVTWNTIKKYKGYVNEIFIWAWSLKQSNLHTNRKRA